MHRASQLAKPRLRKRKPAANGHQLLLDKLHPPPHEFDVLEHWIELLAAEYGVSKLTFCRQALGLTPTEIALLRDNPPEQALQQLKNMSIHTLFRRITEALERFRQEDPEGFTELERQCARLARHPAANS
ncbi:MAG TPA: hypothetical protein VH592_02355 [Gemmataceae bacterium]